jgi:general secretion pathway protein D
MTKSPLATTIASLLSIVAFTPAMLLPHPAFAASAESTAARELARRPDYVARGQAAIDAGAKAYKDKDYETAVAQYKLATDIVPNAPNSRRTYETALDGFCNASVKLAEQRITEGRYADAENLCKQVLNDIYNPRYKAAAVLLHRLETPGYYNRTIGPKFRGTVEEVKRLLLEAQGFYDSARYDLAFKRCDQVLNLDPYNIAARKMQEKINLQRDNFQLASYNEHRSRAIWESDKAWARPVRKFGLKAPEEQQQTQSPEAIGTARINAKLNRIILPKLEFKDATIREAVDFLKRKSAELDSQEPDPSKRGVNIVLKLDNAGGVGVPPPVEVPAPVPTIPGLEPAPAPAAPALPAVPQVNPNEARITVALTNIPLLEALKYVTNLASLKFKVEPYAVSIVPLGTPTEVLINKTFTPRPGFITRAAAGGAEATGLAPTAPADATRGGSGIAKQQDAKEFLMASGVPFPQGSSASYLPSTSRLIVRNTQENLDLIEALIEADKGAGVAAQVEVEAKFVEITQTNLKELSFDWMVGQFNFPGTSEDGVFVGGGTSGSSGQQNQQNFPFNLQNGAYSTYPVTAGNRSGDFAISGNAIDALLFGTGATKFAAPAIAGVAGIMTDPSFQVAIRALNQKKGVDLLSAPKVTTKSGQRAIIEIIREFKYPTEFDPPQIPQNFGNQGGFNVTPTLVQPPSSFPVTPTTPTTFEVRNTGVTLEVEPVIGPDQYTIDLNLVPQVVEFEGFINYGSPIQTTSTNALGITTTNVITPNVINQPIFSTRKVTTSVSIFDGQTVVLGGLIREDVQKIEDKTPLLGDLPVLGRLFRSQVDQHVKRHLIIFVTARLINPAGEPTRSEEEVEEVIETLPMPEAQSPLPELPLIPK